jgi:hypothetical protein
MKSEQSLWVRRGDHRQDGERLITKCIRENGRLVGEPTVLLREYPKGIATVLSAAGDWWWDEMLLHPEWGDALDDNGAILTILDHKGNKPAR